jgi:hypothetical protein
MVAAGVTPKSPLLPLFSKGEFPALSPLFFKERGRGDFVARMLLQLCNEVQIYHPELFAIVASWRDKILKYKESDRTSSCKVRHGHC